MLIYKSEREVPGLAEKIQANACIAYNVQLQELESDEYHRERIFQPFSACGSIKDIDLFFTKSVFVSTNWNKNDDVLDPVEVWAARNTPVHKPTNMNHDEKLLVGHITDVWAMDNDGQLIPDETLVDDLPNLYHLVNGAVIYKKWSDKALVERTEALIDEIRSGTKFVSMEALFSNFSYAIVTPEKEMRVVARCQDTAFLTKHLRVYGGTGEYDGCKIGRVLRNIVFSGKGYVDKPANNASVILQAGDMVFDFSKANAQNPFNVKNGVIISYTNANSNVDTEHDMSGTDNGLDLVVKENNELKATVAKLQAQLADVSTQATQAKIKEFETSVADLTAKLSTSETKVSDLSNQLKASNDKAVAFEKQVADLTAEINTAKAEKVTADRVNKLVDGNIERSEAEAKVKLFANLSDEQFTVVADELINAAKVKAASGDDKKKADEDAKKKKDDEAKANDPTSDPAAKGADTKVLDNAQANVDPKLAANPADDGKDKTEKVRNELRKAMASRMLGDQDNDNDE